MMRHGEPSPHTPIILWCALLGSQFIYVGLLLAPGLLTAPSTEPPEPGLALVFAAVAIALAITSFVLPMVLLRTALANAEVEIEEVPTGFRQMGPSIRRFANLADAERVSIRVGLTPMILGLALSEAVSVLGFILGFLGHPMLVWTLFFVCGIVLTAIRFPTRQRFLEALARAKHVSL